MAVKTCGTVRVTGKNINNDSEAGGIVGYSIGQIIENCNNKGKVISAYNDAGGIAALLNTGCSVINCQNNNSVTTEKGVAVGGIVGQSLDTINIIGCINNGEISALEPTENTNISVAGGIVGNIIKGTINNCTNNSNVKAKGQVVGGIAGQLIGSTANNCNNEGYIYSETGCAGGIAGINNIEENSGKFSKIENSYNKGKIEATGYLDDVGKAAVIGGIARYK